MDELIDFFFPRLPCSNFFRVFIFFSFLDLKKIGIDEVSYTIDIKQGKVIKG